MRGLLGFRRIPNGFEARRPAHVEQFLNLLDGTQRGAVAPSTLRPRPAGTGIGLWARRRQVHEADGRAELYLAWPAAPGCSSRPLPPTHPNAFNVSTQETCSPAQDSVPHGRLGSGSERPRPVRLGQGSRPARRVPGRAFLVPLATRSDRGRFATVRRDRGPPWPASGVRRAARPDRRPGATAAADFVGLVRFTPQPRPRWSRPRTQIAKVPAHWRGGPEPWYAFHSRTGRYAASADRSGVRICVSTSRRRSRRPRRQEARLRDRRWRVRSGWRIRPPR